MGWMYTLSRDYESNKVNSQESGSCFPIWVHIVASQAGLTQLPKPPKQQRRECYRLNSTSNATKTKQIHTSDAGKQIIQMTVQQAST
jgi:hypothetical protein